MSLHRDPDGTLPAFAWPGGYPIYYLTADGGEMCPDCANGKNGSEASETEEDPQWQLVAQDVHYEGAPIQCCHCGTEIESAYGDPDTDDAGPVCDLDAIDPGPVCGAPILKMPRGYTRVVPRDLFNESKLLKGLGQLALLIHDGRAGEELRWEEPDGEDGFGVSLDGDNCWLYAANLRLYRGETEVQLVSPYNSRECYPLLWIHPETGEAEDVFDPSGALSDSFRAWLGL